MDSAPTIEPLELPPGPAVLAHIDRIARALDGTGPAIAPTAPGAPAPNHLDARNPPLPVGLALAVATSGSTGRVKRSMLTIENIEASNAATVAVIGTEGNWVLALPPHHIAGLQVIARALRGGNRPVVVDASNGFTPEAFVTATEALPAQGRRYTSLVPTQLTRILVHPEATCALAAYDAVLVGGAATPLNLVDLATDAGARLYLTYGASETAGGCVYNGYPLPGVQVYADSDGHLVLGGLPVAHGYLGQPGLSEGAFRTDADGRRWFRTDDLGGFDDAGRVVIRGRADDLINTGGIKVAPGPVEDAVLRYVDGISDAVVVGIAHPSWGQAVALAVTTFHGARVAPLTIGEIRATLRGVVPDHSLPHELLVLDQIPMRGPGKPDRAAIAEAFDEAAAPKADDSCETGSA